MVPMMLERVEHLVPPGGAFGEGLCTYMDRLHVVVEHCDDLPDGLPAVWTADSDPRGDAYIRLYLLRGLPEQLGDSFRSMAIRSLLPAEAFDTFQISPSTASVAGYLQSTVDR